MNDRTVTGLISRFIRDMAEATHDVNAVVGFELNPTAMAHLVRENGPLRRDADGVALLMNRRIRWSDELSAPDGSHLEAY